MKEVRPLPINIHEYAIPKGAQYYLASKSGAPNMFYRWNTIKYSDGTLDTRLEYFSFAGMWMGSDANDKNTKDLETFVGRLIKINEKPGYTLSYHAIKKEWGIPVRFDEYIRTKEELDLLVEIIKADASIKLAYYQEDRCSLGVLIKNG